MAALAPLSGLHCGPTCLGCFDILLGLDSQCGDLTFDGVFQISSVTQPDARRPARADSNDLTGSLNVLSSDVPTQLMHTCCPNRTNSPPT